MDFRYLIFDIYNASGGAWVWRRRLFAWEEELVGEIKLLLLNVNLQVNKDDWWLWSLENSKSFLVRSVYNYITAQIPTYIVVPVSSLWHKDVPLKVVLFAWRVFRDRLPIKDNLFRRGVIDQNSLECVAACDSSESSVHLLLHCNVFEYVWHQIYKWLGIYVVAPQHWPENFVQFSFIGGTSKVCQSILQVI